MRKYIYLALLILMQPGCAIASSDAQIISSSIGELVLFHDQNSSYQTDLNPFGTAKIYNRFLEIYNERIKNLPEEKRVKFLWSSMWHLDFDGHSMNEFQILVLNDCGEAFIQRLEEYVKKESELKRNRRRLYLSEKVLGGLKYRTSH